MQVAASAQKEAHDLLVGRLRALRELSEHIRKGGE
jgi:hypothetical protein